MNYESIIAAVLRGESPNSGSVALDNAARSIAVMAKAYGHTAEDMADSLRSWAVKNVEVSA